MRENFVVVMLFKSESYRNEIVFSGLQMTIRILEGLEGVSFISIFGILFSF